MTVPRLFGRGFEFVGDGYMPSVARVASPLRLVLEPAWFSSVVWQATPRGSLFPSSRVPSINQIVRMGW